MTMRQETYVCIQGSPLIPKGSLAQPARCADYEGYHVTFPDGGGHMQVVLPAQVENNPECWRRISDKGERVAEQKRQESTYKIQAEILYDGLRSIEKYLSMARAGSFTPGAMHYQITALVERTKERVEEYQIPNQE